MTYKMKNIFKNKIYSFFTIILFAVFLIGTFSLVSGKALAETDAAHPSGGDGVVVNNPDTSNNNDNQTNQPTESHNLVNPLAGGVDNLPDFIRKILNVVLTIGVPIVTLAIIYCGFLFVSARGDAKKLEAAKDALLYTVIGAAILFGAWVLAQALKETVDQIRSAV